MKTVESLAKAMKNTKIGNHKVVMVNDGLARNFIYYNTTICSVCDIKRTFVIDASYGTTSTTRACNAYRRYFAGLGYKEVV